MLNEERKADMLAWCRLCCEKITLPTDAEAALFDYLENHAEEAAAYLDANREMQDPEGMKKEIIERDGALAYVELLAFTILRAQETLALYRSRGYEESVFWDGMQDIAIWCGNCREKTGEPGLEEFFWESFFLKAEIVTLGRLQFQVCDLHKPAWTSDEELATVGLKNGDPVLNVHIPQGRPLKKEECLRSFELAKAFFKDYDYKMFVCETWLIYPRNHEYMRPGANILDFETLFEVISTCDNPHLAVERIWNYWNEFPADVHDYEENTSLQRAAKQYLLSGGKLGEGFGVRR